jgi:hypothetical protein
MYEDHIMSLTVDDVKKFITENGTPIFLVVLLFAVVYVNIKINDIDYRLQQTIVYSPLRQNDRFYESGYFPYNTKSRWI